jgi:hypothetical protein
MYENRQDHIPVKRGDQLGTPPTFPLHFWFATPGEKLKDGMGEGMEGAA